MVALTPIVFTASCSLVKTKDDQKFDYSNSKILKGKIIKFQKSFDFQQNFKTAGILQSVNDFDNFVDNIKTRTWKNEIDENVLIAKNHFVSLFKDKYNQKFFETKSVVFYNEGIKLVDFLDSVIEKHGQLYLNYIYVDVLEDYDKPIISPGFTGEDKIYFVEIPKQYGFVRVNVNYIATLKDFKDLKNKNYYKGYGVNDSKEENKNNYEYEDLK